MDNGESQAAPAERVEVILVYDRSTRQVMLKANTSDEVLIYGVLLKAVEGIMGQKFGQGPQRIIPVARVFATVQQD